MLKKITRIVLKILVGCFIFYLVVAGIVLPVALKWGIESQGAKALRHPVKVASVMFNPFLWRLDARGFKVLDSDGQVMAGFDRLSVDASFLALFKKTYRIESLVVEGLKINVVLLDAGHVNLMDLVPVAVPPANSPAPKEKAAASLSSPQALPLVVVDVIMFKNGQVNFLDRSIHPNFSVTLNDIDLKVTGLSTKPDSTTNALFHSRLGEKGVITSEVNLKPLTQPIELETSLALNGFALDVLTPYVGKYTGRSLKDGALEFKMDYRISGNKLTATHKVLVQRFAFGQKVESKDALPLPFGLVVALLEDPEGRIKISLPVTGDMSKPDFHYWSLLGQVVSNFFTGLITKPFAFLASAMGAESGTDELGYVRFLPGKADIPEAEQKKIITLLAGLKEHPKLKLEVNGGYDPDTDWKAIKIDTLAKDYAEIRRTSTRSESSIYQMLYQRRLGIRDLWTLTKKYKVKEGTYDDEKLIAEIKRQLIENAAVDKPALLALAAARAKAVYDFIVAAGFDAARLSVGASRQEQGSMGFVPLEFTLTVFGDTPSDTSLLTPPDSRGKLHQVKGS
ncbi:MAG: DUF748 domain-containing protein [Candidatus Omnitrophica bacterium]|nr:DUF748 domain-containing protein [Candidatus Omnitrophota bacterium]